MGIQIQGSTGTIADVGGTGFRALITTNKPYEYGALGHYSISAETTAMAAGLAANSEILQIRWTDATRLCLIQKITIEGIYATTAFAVGAIRFTATIARSFSAAGTGGTALTLTGNTNKMRTSMGTTLMGEIRVATTAALGAGTKTLDTNFIGAINSHSSAGTGAATPIIGSIFLPSYDLFEQDSADGEHPAVLAQNEGLIVRATVPATGVWTASIRVKWAEVASY